MKDYIVLTIIIAVIFVLMIVVLNYIYKKTYNEKFKNFQDKVNGVQMVETKEIFMTMRGWRHDYHNHMQKIKAHMALKQYDEATRYINSLEADLDKVDIKYQSGNISVDAIINSKLSIASKQGININCKAVLPKELPIKDIDLCVILGNLIDNAIESCESMPDQEQKFMRVYIAIVKKQLYISMTNSTKEVVRKIDADYISSKRGNHGHGLKRINDAVNAYNGFINRKNEPGVFITEIMLPLFE